MDADQAIRENFEMIESKTVSIQDVSESTGVAYFTLVNHYRKALMVKYPDKHKISKTWRANQVRTLLKKREAEVKDGNFINMADIAREVGVSREYVRLIRRENQRFDPK